jgi:argininosuccinate synthase
MSGEKCVLAYSGGLDTSALVPYMKEKYGYDIIAVLVDVGRMKDVEGLRQRAITAGAIESIVIDAKEEFLREYAFPALQANALYEGRYPLHSALSRPLIAKKMVEVAKSHGAKVVAHGCTAKGNDQVRIDVSVRCLDPSVTVLGPAREWNMTRPELLDYLEQRGIDLPLTKKNPYSIDENLWGRAIECGELEDPWTAAPSGAFQFTVDPEKAPDKAQEVVVGFEAGIPVSLDGKEMDPISLVEQLRSTKCRVHFRSSKPIASSRIWR